MRKFIIYISVLYCSVSFSQETISELLKQFNTQSIPYITVQELAMPKTEAIILDARELKEYKVSHIKNAIHVGYDNFNIDTISNAIKDKDTQIVVYCSLGIRSEDVAEKLKKSGYTNIYNLYGGIFEWKNNNYDVYDTNSIKTELVHTFSKEWSKWLQKGIKVYD